MKKTLLALAVALSMPMAAAQADPNNGNGNTGRPCSDATDMLASPFYVDCRGYFDGNIGGSNADVAGLTGGQWTGPWTFVQKFTFSPAGNEGTVTFTEAIKTRFILGIKAADSYSFYLYDGSKVAGGTDSEFWQTIGTAANKNNGGAGISHLNLYVGQGGGGGDPDCVTNPNDPRCGGTTVPEPSTYALMGAGLLALGFVARRRRQNV